MPRKPLGDRPMSNAERQARHRAVRAAALPVIHYRRTADHRSRARRWRDAVAVLLTLQAEYRAWLQALPDSLQEGAIAGKEGPFCTPIRGPDCAPIDSAGCCLMPRWSRCAIAPLLLIGRSEASS